MSQSHSFSVSVANVVGMESAVILSHIGFWYQKNRANNRNLYDGKYWSYNSRRSFGETFSYLTENQIRGSLFRLELGGYIETGLYNENKYDRTKWYTLTDKGLLLLGLVNNPDPLVKLTNETGEINQPIPDSKTDITQIKGETANAEPPRPDYPNGWDVRHISQYTDWLEYRNAIKGVKKLKPISISKQLKQLSGLTLVQLIKCIEYSISNGYQGLFPDKFKSTDKQTPTTYVQPKTTNRRYIGGEN